MRLDRSKVAAMVDADYGRVMLAEGDRAQAGNPERDQVWNLLVTEVDPDPDQPRRYFDEKALNDLATDIGRRGVLQPIIVRPIGERYQIVVGERRWRASRMANKPRIPCLIREMSETEVRQAQLVENVIREGISDIERGQALKQLYDTMKAHDTRATWENVAQLVGLTHMRIHQLYNLSTLPSPIVEMIRSRQLSGTHGLELARLQDRPEAQSKLAEEACRSASSSAFGLSVAELRRRVSSLLGVQVSRPAPLLSPAEISERSRQLLDALRPGLPAEVLLDLRETARHMMLFAEQHLESPESIKSILLNSKRMDPGSSPANSDTSAQ